MMAKTFGDGEDRPQITAQEDAFRSLMGLPGGLGLADPAGQGGRRLAHPAKHVGQFAAQGRGHPLEDPIDTPLDVTELIEQGQEAAGPQRRFGEEPCRVPAAADQAATHCFAPVGIRSEVADDPVVIDIPEQQTLRHGQPLGQFIAGLSLLGGVGHAGLLDDLVKRFPAIANGPNMIHRALQYEVASQYIPAKSHARGMDLLDGRPLLLIGQHRHLPDFQQVDSDGVHFSRAPRGSMPDKCVLRSRRFQPPGEPAVQEFWLHSRADDNIMIGTNGQHPSVGCPRHLDLALGHLDDRAVPLCSDRHLGLDHLHSGLGGGDDDCAFRGAVHVVGHEECPS